MTDLLLINIPFIIVLVVLIYKIVKATKRGAVKEICDIIAMFVASILVLLIAFAVRKYMDQQRAMFIVTIVLLFLLVAVYKVIEIFLTTLKIISKLPGINFVNKLLGIPLAIVETIIIVWAVYCIILIMDVGTIETWIMNCVNANPVMGALYKYNYIYPIVDSIRQSIAAFDIWGKLGM